MCVCCRLDIHQRLLVSPMTNWHVGDTVHTHTHTAPSALGERERQDKAGGSKKEKKGENFVLAERCWRDVRLLLRKKEKSWRRFWKSKGEEKGRNWTEIQGEYSSRKHETKSDAFHQQFHEPVSSWSSSLLFFFLSVCPFTLWEMSFSLALARRPICSSEDDDVADLRSSALIRSECEIVGPHRNWIWHLHEPLCTVRPDCCNRSVEMKLSPM